MLRLAARGREGSRSQIARREHRVQAFDAYLRAARPAELPRSLLEWPRGLSETDVVGGVCGLDDADGNTISIGLGLPMFIRGLSDAIKAKIEFWGKENIEPGDILLTNDSYVMGSHLNHMIFTLPVFNDGELVAFSSSMAHWQDIGGTLGTRETGEYIANMIYKHHHRGHG